MATARLLIVEDSELTAAALRVLFEANGYDVAVARSVVDAIHACARDAPEVMLLDLTLPDGDGLTVLQHVAAAGAVLPRTIALTGHDDDDTRDRCIDAGCADVLLKPVPIAQLLARVRSL